uniref:Uncharacterized protein n=1 Tax=Megaselia scalaris TaxID=36166 RepID=T1H1V9_MEGSC
MEVVKATATEILGMQKPQKPSRWRHEEMIKLLPKKIRFIEKRPKNTRATKGVSKQKEGGLEVEKGPFPEKVCHRDTDIYNNYDNYYPFCLNLNPSVVP